MKTDEIDVLTPNTLKDLLELSGVENPSAGPERRRASRWPFPGTVELWLEHEGDAPDYRIGTCANLNLHGVGLYCDEPLEEGREVSLAIHQPALSLCGRAVVQHCHPAGAEHYAGLEFLFPPGVSKPKG